MASPPLLDHGPVPGAALLQVPSCCLHHCAPPTSFPEVLASGTGNSASPSLFLPPSKPLGLALSLVCPCLALCSH